MSIRTKIGNAAWVVFLCIMIFVITAALWIWGTYGTLTFAMVNESFRNGLQNNRMLFVIYVVLPTAVIFVILLIAHIVCKKKNKRRAAYISAFLLGLSVCAAVMILDVGSYLGRQYRLAGRQWYNIDNVVIHALGSIDGVTYTNSKEALEYNYEAGKRLFECDLIMTADEDYIPTLDDFVSHKVMGKYTPLSVDDIMQFLKEHSDMYIITDTKYSKPEEIKEEFYALVDAVARNDCEEMLDRFVVQIYHMYMHDIVNEIYPFPNYIFTLYSEGYKGEEDRIQQYAEFCMLHDIDVITMNTKYYQDGLADICEWYGIHMFVHTVNADDEIEAYREKGIGVYTDHT